MPILLIVNALPVCCIEWGNAAIYIICFVKFVVKFYQIAVMCEKSIKFIENLYYEK